MKNRDPYAKALASPLFRKRVVQPKKGRGSYSRKQSKDIRKDLTRS
jgi:stalled ribosome alternative rescue factor ArfA